MIFLPDLHFIITMLKYSVYVYQHDQFLIEDQYFILAVTKMYARDIVDLSGKLNKLNLMFDKIDNKGLYFSCVNLGDMFIRSELPPFIDEQLELPF